MSEFIFENAEKVIFRSMSLDDSNLIFDAWRSGELVEYYSDVNCKYRPVTGAHPLDKNEAYRVLAKPYLKDNAIREALDSTRTIATQHISGDFVDYDTVINIIEKLAASKDGGK